MGPGDFILVAANNLSKNAGFIVIFVGGTWDRRVLFLFHHIIQTMAGLERLIPYIYHEKQQEGSMLCAQHALNSLLRTSQQVCCSLLIYFSRGQLCTFLDDVYHRLIN